MNNLYNDIRQDINAIQDKIIHHKTQHDNTPYDNIKQDKELWDNIK